MPTSAAARDARLLILQVPGLQARNYLSGIALAARAAGLPTLNVDLGAVRRRIRQAGLPVGLAARLEGQRLEKFIRQRRITHSVGYAYNGLADFGLRETADGPRFVVPSLGVRHIALWTDHPDWANNAAALGPGLRSFLDDPGIVHVVKSAPAAAELAEVTGWRLVTSLPMAEDPVAVGPVVRRAKPTHDTVAICGTMTPIPGLLAELLGEDDVRASEIRRRMVPTAAGTAMRAVRLVEPHADMDTLEPLARRWAWESARSPDRTCWEVTRSLRDEHAAAFDWLLGDARRWYAMVGGLRRINQPMRSFWLAWLGRRADVGVYGCSAAAIGLRQPAGADRWVPYARQGATYAMGRTALNINQAHDEAGGSHKPFQIAASGVPMVHAAGPGIEGLFTPGVEQFTFDSGPSLLAAVEAVRHDPAMGTGVADAAHRRFLADHTWRARLPRLLDLADRLTQTCRPAEPTRTSADNAWPASDGSEQARSPLRIAA